MTNLPALFKAKTLEPQQTGLSLAESITRSASKQTYFTIRLLADRDRVADAFRAYAYYRWVDDILDADGEAESARMAFIQRQISLLEACYRGESVQSTSDEEQLLVELIRGDTEQGSGLHTYLCNLMAVMVFDANRRGRVISQSELNKYTELLASAVMEGMHHFIGHCFSSPQTEARYLAVSAAHISHMLRDTYDDLPTGYYNIPREVLLANHIKPQDVGSDAYRAWVCSRVQLARSQFTAGREYLNQVENLRCRLAGLAYVARFEIVLDTIEKEGYLLRPDYTERRSLGSGFRMVWMTLAALVNGRKGGKHTASTRTSQRSLREL